MTGGLAVGSGKAGSSKAGRRAGAVNDVGAVIETPNIFPYYSTPSSVVVGNKSYPLYSDSFRREDASAVGVYGNVAVGQCNDSSACYWVYPNQVPTILISPSDAVARGINSSSVIVGGAGTAPIEWLDDTYELLPHVGISGAYSINQSGVVAGDDGSDAVTWTNGVEKFLPRLAATDTSDYAMAINKSGQVAGFAFQVDGLVAVLWSNGVPTRLANIDPNVQYCYAMGINDAGSVVGICQTALGTRAVLWQHGAAIDLNIYLSAAQRAAGWTLGGSANTGQWQGIAISNTGIISATAANYSVDLFATNAVRLSPKK